MGKDAEDRVGWLLELPAGREEWLAPIRHWPALKVATGEGALWVSGLDDAGVTAVAVRAIPQKNVWRQQGNMLFAQDSLVPSRRAPSLLWTPIVRGLPLELPPENHNLFDVPASLEISLVRSDPQAMPAALRISMHLLRDYVEAAPAVRLSKLQWVVLDGAQAMITGTPLLPLPGDAYWYDGGSWLPAGYDFEWPSLRQAIRQRLGGEGDDLIFWNADGTYIRIAQSRFRPLSISSFRQTHALLAAKQPDAR